MRFLPQIETVAVSQLLTRYLEETLPLAAGSEKGRSELIISPVLVKLRHIFDHQISVFSGEEFNVDEALSRNRVCDFLITRSPKLLAIEAPAVRITDMVRDSLDEHQILQTTVEELGQVPGVYCCDAGVYDEAYSTVTIIRKQKPFNIFSRDT